MTTRRVDKYFFVFTSIPYLILLLGMLNTQNIYYGLKVLETRSSLLLYPLCFALIPKKEIKWQIENRLNYILGFFCFATFIFSLSIFFYFKIFEERTLSYIIQHNNTLMNISIYSKYQIHPIYLALNVGVSLIFSFFIHKTLKNNNLKLLNSIFILFSVLLLAIINKRMAIISLIIVGLIYLILNFKKNFKKNRTLFYYVIFIILIFLGVVFFPRYKDQNSFNEFKKISSVIYDPETSIGKRVYLYRTAIDIFLKNPLLGIGTGDADINLSDRLVNKLQIKYQNYNTHNQYLSYLVSLGLFGFIIFMVYLFYILKISIIRNDILFICLFVFLCLNMLSENILERESGVLVYAFFINFLLKSNWNFKNKNIK